MRLTLSACKVQRIRDSFENNKHGGTKEIKRKMMLLKQTTQHENEGDAQLKKVVSRDRDKDIDTRPKCIAYRCFF
jgi:hypothetical protein